MIILHRNDHSGYILKMKVLKYLSGIVFVMVVFSLNAQEKSLFIQAEATVSPSIIHIGDTIHYRLVVRADPSLLIDFPEISDHLGGFSIKEFSPVKTEIKNGIKEWSRSLELNTFVTGDYIIPPAVIRYSKEKVNSSLNSGAVYVRVDSLLKGEYEDIKDIIPPQVLPYTSKWIIWGLWIGIPIFFIALVIFIVRFFQKRIQKQIEIRRPSWETALEELEDLEERNLLHHRKVKEYYYALSDILRRYIEKRFGLMAPERTTEEFMKLMRTKAVFSESHQLLLSRFLKECDLVKFAKSEPEPNESNKGTEIVRSFIMETREPETACENERERV